jgi:AcrR family transcriptional regulator
MYSMTERAIMAYQAGRVAVAMLDPGERQKVERRRQIIAAAKSVFADSSYHGASINAIIERAQIARGTF